ncbi:molybdopterin-guanine dinucleotide biosynthesis protein B [Gilliamella sp. wkB18]|uniref:molybdopterin-guanine dinucleotide biosynthesis protein B n=1 Tax=Gilliamella sp. wkB18 TaxID=3120260 RepID=UPI0004DCC18D|nr:molybdopterin-guanine dinucleotide biosynthesis protein B [Gilliamella apicola]KFA58214.1 Molybdopterin-guanine dinucleotide biosynthesis protein MobB [Gilliamella apicola]OCG65816.1 molybdopterin-guanine dinucleotide biosynthesis protein B [Gilliamella apicola]
MNNRKIIGISGYSGSGKTTLLKKIIPLLIKQDFKVGILKHAHHNIEVDIPGKDSYELRKAGASQTIIACDNRYALIEETPNNPTDLQMLINQFTNVDIILVEGFKEENIPKIICHRSTIQKPLYMDQFTIAIACDEPLNSSIKELDLNQPIKVVEFLKNFLYLN